MTDIERDAMRYRWLKQAPSIRLESSVGRWTDAEGRNFWTTHYLAAYSTQFPGCVSLDATIDLAMECYPLEEGRDG